MDGGGAFAAFVEAHLPAPPGRVLEVGCGRGDLARAVARLGYSVTAIDPKAPPGAMFCAVTLEEFSDPGPFDAVLANLALHHIHDLSGALAKIRQLLRPGGQLILNEHAWDDFDEPTSWAANHTGPEGFAAMRSELGRSFEERFFAWMPHPGFRYVGERPSR
jgi:2-polyprenyl-3-methyl-5-hydroxy-6-metoxy-1,4-benzoquinol methylase